MTAEIITIGDELLIGQVIDTNSVWISRALEDHGFRVMRKQTVGDDEPEILRALRESEQRVDVVLLTGGLGPTKDDVTLNALCKHFDTSSRPSSMVCTAGDDGFTTASPTRWIRCRTSNHNQ